MVPAWRAADVLGFLSILLICLLLPRASDRGGLGFSAMAAAITGAVAAHAGSLMHLYNIPELSITEVWIYSALLAVVVFVVTYRPRAWPGYVLGGTLALLLVWDVNPVLVGLGDLRDSDVAAMMLDEGARARAENEVWAADTRELDSLMIATGVPALSGRQMSGPDVEAWSRFAPGEAEEEVWNRGGGSFIWFKWKRFSEMTLTTVQADVIQISGSPCSVAEHEPRLSRIIVSREFPLPCLTEVDRFTWGGETRWVYAVNE
jgi:hypothetical protein